MAWGKVKGLKPDYVAEIDVIGAGVVGGLRDGEPSQQNNSVYSVVSITGTAVRC